MKKGVISLAISSVLLAGCNLTTSTTSSTKQGQENQYCDRDQTSCTKQCREDHKNPDSLLQNCLQQCQINSPQCETDSKPGSWEVRAGW
ncbi:hypothetical protein ACFOEE_12805 [Pseudoalteromonas fenneropenaei]|uniref:Lipoprotein n=1 Tax=Pseudoalteromonas fenneropenaei TaxID=1737459 RepID=A0ABV7CL65_9GAMM